MKKYDIVYSLGTDCACAMYLKKARLRLCSGPFDWLTRAKFSVRMDLILNDFDRFLEIDDLKFLPKQNVQGNDVHCDYYENIHNDFYYYHDFEAGKKLEETFPEVKEKYRRRIDRFIKNVREKENVLFVWLAHDQKVTDEELMAYSQKINEKFAKKIDFLVIEHNEVMELGKIEQKTLSDSVTRYFLYSRAEDEFGNPTTLGQKYYVLPLFKTVDLKFSLKHFMNSVGLFGVKALIPKGPLKNKMKKFFEN